MMTAADEWSGIDYELVFEVATGMPAMHRHLVDRLAPRAGEHWLDVATGTGRVARLAARAGATVIAQDISPSMIDTARRLTDAEGLSIDFDVGDCQALTYADGSFDVISSAVGATFAPDHRAVARELARVCRRGGRIGLVAWRPDPGFRAIFEPFEPAGVGTGGGDYSDWGREEHASELLGSAFELRFEEGDAPITGASGLAIWEIWLRSIGSTRALYESLEPARREQLRGAFSGYFERFRMAGRIEQPNPYLLILGTRV